jgi:SagB-type dehydrogenase family enzyme
MFVASAFVLSQLLFAQTPKTVALNPPDLTRGVTVMKALSARASEKEFDTTNLKLQDLSDLLWAANGINRPDAGKRTAPSAMNSQDIDVYAVTKAGVYLYNPQKSSLEPVAAGDYRKQVAGKQENFAKAPLLLVLVSDLSKFPTGNDSLRNFWAAADAGTVSQNISLFCASAGLATRPRATMDQEVLSKLLKLDAKQKVMLNHPVSYKKQ